MPLKTIISHVPDMRYVTLYSDYLIVTSSAPNAAAAAAILSVLEFWTKIKLGSNEQAIADALAKGANGADVDLWVWRTHAELSEDMASVFSESTIRRQIEWLVESALIETRNNPHNKWDRKIQYRLNIDLINEMFRHVNPRFVQVTKWIFSSDNIEWVMWQDDLYQYNISLDRSHSLASDDATTPDTSSFKEEDRTKDTSTVRSTSTEINGLELQENISAPAATRPTPPPPPKAAAATLAVAGKPTPPSKPRKAKAVKKQPKRTRAEQDAALEVLMQVGLDGVRNTGLAAKMLKLLDTVVAATLGIDERAVGAVVRADNLAAFYKWYERENNFDRPKGDKLPNWFMKWWRESGQQLTSTVPANSEGATSRKTLPPMRPMPTRGYVKSEIDNNYYHHTIIETIVDMQMNGRTIRLQDIPPIYADENGE